MIDVTVTWDLRPGIDHQAYAELSKRAVGAVLNAPGFVEFRAHRNIIGSPQVRASYLWHSLADWASFQEAPEWQSLAEEFHSFATNVSYQIWGPSPVITKPLRPGQ